MKKLKLPEISFGRRSAHGFHEVAAAWGFSHNDGGSFVCKKIQVQVKNVNSIKTKKK